MEGNILIDIDIRDQLPEPISCCLYESDVLSQHKERVLQEDLCGISSRENALDLQKAPGKGLAESRCFTYSVPLEACDGQTYY